MTKTRLTGMTALALAAGLGFAQYAGAGEGGVQSLRGADVAVQDRAPDEWAQVGKKPGLQKPLPRSFKQQPPLISHATANFDEITLDENQCLSCHDEANYKKKKAPLIGKSHMQMKDGKPTKVMDKSRHFCTQCHVPQFDAQPLVGNTFKPVSLAK